MKKNIIVMLLCALFVTGCQSKPKATDKIEFYLSSTLEDQNVIYLSTYTYNEDEVITGKIEVKYSNLAENNTNYTLFDQYRILQGSLDEMDGITVTIKTTDTGYNYKEKWNYLDIDIEQVTIIDSRQTNFITNGKYDMTKIKEYYQKQGFTSSHSEIKDK